jgi:Ca2+-binding RTX toxin-like protein
MTNYVWRRFLRTIGLAKGERSPVRYAPARSRLGIEALEDRVVPASLSGDFVALQNGLDSFLGKAESVIHTVSDAAHANIPIINTSISDLFGQGEDSPMATFDEFVSTLDDAIEQLYGLDSDNLETEAEQALNDLLGVNGAGILLSDAVVTLPTNENDNLIDVKLHLGKMVETSYQVGLGLESLPFDTDATFNFQVGFELPTINFGLDKDGAFFIGTDTPDPNHAPAVSLFARTTMTGFTFDAEFGFLALHASTNDAEQGDPPRNALGVSFDVPVLNINADDVADMFGTPGLNGSAKLDLHLKGGFSDDLVAAAQVVAPSVEADFVLSWTFSDSQAQTSDSTFGENLQVAFNNVKVNLGTYVTQMIAPTIEKVQQFVEPYKDFFKMLGEPIPVVSDLAEVFGDNDGVSILDLAQIASATGVIPPDYSALVTIGTKVVQVTNVIEQIQTQLVDKGKLSNAFIELGNFDLVGHQQTSSEHPDLREVPAASSTRQITDVNWSSLESIVDSIQVGEMKQKITEAFGEDQVNKELGKALNSALDDLENALNGQGTANAAGYKLSLPITEKPIQAVVGMLVGQDTDLVSFEAWANLNGMTTIPLVNYSGFEIVFEGGITLDAYMKLGYDTYGLRQVASKLFNNEIDNAEEALVDLANGFYIDPNTHLVIGGSVGLKGGLNYGLASAHVKGSLTAGISVIMPDMADLNGDGIIDPTEFVDTHGESGTESPDNKIRPYEFHDDLFVVQGSLSGDLDLEFKLGIDPFSISESIHLAGGEIASFDTGGVNPFVPDGIQLAHQLNDGTLVLNIGTYHSLLNSPQYANAERENVLITHYDAEDGPSGESVLVTMFGVTKRFDGVTAIYAEAGDGNDSVTIDEGVNVPVTLLGGNGDDTFTTKGGGAATFYGSLGNDRLTGGSGLATFYGQQGNDVLTATTGDAVFDGGDLFPNSDPTGADVLIGGSGVNVLKGGDGDDLLVGGSGPNTISGNNGNDHLIAGSSDGDTLDGGSGNDRLEAGTGSSTLKGGDGDDEFIWRFADPAAEVDSPDGAVKIEGGNDHDLVMAYGGPMADTFVVKKLPIGNLPYTVQIDAPAAGGGATPLQLAGIEDIDIEAGEGADAITVNDLTDTRIASVGINLQELVKSHYGLGDNVTDTVVVNGTTKTDDVTVTAEPVTIQFPNGTEGASITGGLTTFTGLPEYSVKVANVYDVDPNKSDDVTFNALAGNDTVNVHGITGRTTIRGNGGPTADADNDTFNVHAQTSADYTTELKIDADTGTNALHVFQQTAAGDSFVVTQERIESTLLKAVNFTATGGNHQGGVSLTTGNGPDAVAVRNTLPGVTTTINTGAADDFVLLSSKDVDGLANGIQGTVTVDLGGGSNNLLRLSDKGAASGNANVYIGAGQVLGFAGPSDNTAVNFAATGGGQMALHVEGSNGAQPERFVVDKPTARLTLDTFGGNDTVDVAALDQIATINTGADNDTVRIGYGNNKLDAVKSLASVTAGAGNDSVTVLDSAAPAAGSYTLGTNTFTRAGAGGVWFDTSLEALTANTTGVGDTIAVTGTPVAANVLLDANGGGDTLTGPNADTVWQLTGSNAGKLGGNVSFTEVENLAGGTGNDRFRLTNTKTVAGTITGGGGTADTLDFSDATVGITVNLVTKMAASLAGFDGIEEFVGGASAADEIRAPNLPNLWQITGTNSGQIGTMALGTLKFSGIESLRGGTSSDSFGFGPSGSVTGTVRGETGTDTLDYSALTNAARGVTVNLTLGTASRVGGSVLDIENVNGSAGDDIIVGNNGANVLNGSAGRDILVGGLGADTINGGDGDDILIGGYTTYDALTNPAALEAIKAEWVSADNYVQRRKKILGVQPGGANGSYKLTSSTVVNDNVSDSMTGGGGTDWFWGNGLDAWDLNGPEKKNEDL